VYPIRNGAIVDQKAFHYFIKLVYKSIARPGYPTALLLASSSRWTRPQIELLTQYVFETVRVPGFSLVPSGLAAAFAFALQDALIIDIGHGKTEITPVLEFAVVSQAQKVIDFGSSNINLELSKLLPELTVQQIEDLKKSPIYEVLSEDDTKNSWFGQQETNRSTEEDGVIDVAAIVASGRTREILAERERQKANPTDQPEQSNIDREFNTFTDSNGKSIEVGKQRFHGTEALIEQITLEVGKVVQKIDQVNRRQDLWDNLVILGRGSSVKGFKDALVSSLNTRYLINRPTTYSELPSTFNTGHNTPLGGTPMYNGGGGNSLHLAQAHQGHGQSPTSVRPAKMPEYFPDWKGRGWEDAAFLGIEIAARPIFTGSVENTFVSKNDYNEVGPTAIWDIGI
jgi:actin-related protein 9